MPEKRNRVRVVGFVSPYIKAKIESAKERGEFGSESDLVATALIEWFQYREMKVTGRGRIRIE